MWKRIINKRNWCNGTINLCSQPSRHIGFQRPFFPTVSIFCLYRVRRQLLRSKVYLVFFVVWINFLPSLTELPRFSRLYFCAQRHQPNKLFDGERQKKSITTKNNQKSIIHRKNFLSSFVHTQHQQSSSSTSYFWLL
jgi:hypothetical protein